VTEAAAIRARRLANVPAVAWGTRNAPLLCLAVGLIASGAVLIALGAHLTFYADEWEMVLWRHGLNADAILDPHNDHIVVGVVIFYKLLLATFGMSSPVPFHVGSTLIYLLAAILLFVYARRCLGDWLAVHLTMPILFLGSASGDLLSPFQVGFSGAIAAGIGALLALDRDDHRWDLAACALLVVSVSFGEAGIVFTIGALVDVALGRRPWRERLYVVLVPLVLYGLWWLGWGYKAQSDLSLHNAANTPRYVLDVAAAGLAGLLGIASPGDQLPNSVGQQWPPYLLAAAVALGAWRIRRVGGVPPGLWRVLAIGTTFWALAGLNQNPLRPPDNGRYIYPSAVLIVLIAAELLRGVRLSTRALLAVACAAAVAVVPNLLFLSDSYRLFWKPVNRLVRADLTALEIAGPVNPSFLLTQDVSPAPFFNISAGTYLSAVDAWGSPAYTQSELASSPEGVREEADRVLGATLGLKLEPGKGTAGTCRTVRASPSGRTGVELGPGTVSFANPRGGARAEVALRRFSDAFPIDAGTLKPGSHASLTIPADASARPWHLGIEGHGPVSICARHRLV